MAHSTAVSNNEGHPLGTFAIDSVAGTTYYQYIVRDFVGSEQFGVRIVTPKMFLQQIGVLP